MSIDMDMLTCEVANSTTTSNNMEFTVVKKKEEGEEEEGKEGKEGKEFMGN